MASWPTLRLEDAGVELIDCVHKTPAAQPTGYPYVGIPQMKSGRIDFSTARLISEADYVEWTRKAKPQRHDVILSRRTNPGVTAVDQTDTPFALGQNLVLLRADGSKVIPPFLRWMTQSPFWWEQIAKFNNVGAVFDSLRCGDVPNFELPVPPTHVQITISELLGALDDKIELNRRTSETLETMARAIFRDWFVDFGPTLAKMKCRAPYLSPNLVALFPDRLDDWGKPDGWRTRRVGDFFSFQRGLSYKGQFLTDHGPPMLNLGCFKGGGSFDYSKAKPYSGEYKPRHLVRGGDLIVANTDMTQNRLVLGSPTVVRGGSDEEFLFSHHVYAGRPKSDDALALARFIYFALLQPEFRERAEGFASGTTVLFLPADAIEALEVTLPSPQVLDAFLSRVVPLFDLIEQKEDECDTLAQTRDLLLPRLMSGELHIEDIKE